MPGNALAVEPDVVARGRIREVLRGLGFRVLEASGPGEALSAASLQDEGLDLLVTEVILPRMNGIELASQLILKSPAMRVLYVSMHMSRFVGENTANLKGSAFLRKPFTDELLLKRLLELAQEV